MSQFTKEEQDKIFLALSKNFNIDINCIFYQLVRDTSSPTSYECFCIRGVNFNHVYFSSFNDIPLCFEECCFEFINFNIKEVKNVCFFRKCKLNTITALGVKFGHFFEISDCNIDKLNFYGHSEFYTYARIYSNKINEILLYYIKFHKVDFSKNIFLKPFTPHNVEFLDNVKFDFCSFQDQVSFYKVSFGKNVRFSDAYFNKKSIFSRAYFKKDVYFNNVKFLSGVNFKESSFFGKAYFSFANFGEVNFSKAIFYDIANFYNTIFSETPNFSQAIFKGNLNAVNTNLNFDFENLEKKINQECEEFNKKEQNKKSLDKFANDFRDSFRVFKNALIKDNNLLDASNFHKCELYCKEIELNSKKPKKFSKEWLDKYQLIFYKNLCDHHTDLILNLKWLIYVIALYILLLGKIFFIYPLCIVVLMVCKCCFKIKNVKVFVSLAIIFMSVCSEPKLIFGVSNLFLNNLNWWQNLVTAIYILTIGLILFSLQKTARKNSIVPS
ncbi:pentapeptide repeat-containing protein [Campylobacter molothri]|uniref:pentapeptide repeat-containing protein n=1 Tax=Campylobacter molothri TaxID=1032242 RepID=UPI00301C484D|nr:pentapeptide repeat-containing protein [Campylobacter sp. RM10538]MBZ7961575.1 pentapeptide repeat-containing protein [Campylobacter sp. RM9930]